MSDPSLIKAILEWVYPRLTRAMIRRGYGAEWMKHVINEQWAEALSPTPTGQKGERE